MNSAVNIQWQVPVSPLSFWPTFIAGWNLQCKGDITEIECVFFCGRIFHIYRPIGLRSLSSDKVFSYLPAQGRAQRNAIDQHITKGSRGWTLTETKMTENLPPASGYDCKVHAKYALLVNIRQKSLPNVIMTLQYFLFTVRILWLRKNLIGLNLDFVSVSQG